MTAAWGEAAEAAEGGSEILPSEIDLGGGFKLKISPDAFQRIMHSACPISGRSGAAVGHW